MNRRGPGGGNHGDDRSRDVGVQDDAARSGFGGRRWSDLPLPTEEVPGGVTPAAPFGRAGWQQYDRDVEEDEEGAPRRRKPPAPPPYPRKTVSALGGTVRVTRDDAGIPHVSARTERDAYAVLGYCMAEDRLWQMDVVRRLALGRSAELFGPGYAGHDALVRTAGIPRRAAAAAHLLTGGARDVLATFTAGVNAARTEGRPPECELLAYEIEPWTIADSLAVELLLAWAASLRIWPSKLAATRAAATSGVERARWVSELPLDATIASGDRAASWRLADAGILDVVAGLPIDAIVGGSAAAVRSPSGAAMLAGALDLAPFLPPLAYLAHLEAPGLSVAGASLIGAPLFALGRNRDCAWSATAAGIDDADCVLEEIDGIGNFRTEAGWSKLATRRELVRVRGGEPLHFDVVESRNGPLVSQLAQSLAGRSPDARRPALAVRWGINCPASGVAGWLALARARAAGDLAGAAALLARGPFAVALVGADRKGQVGRWTAGAMPVRKGNATLAVRGWLGEGAWTGARSLADATSAPSGHAVCAQGSSAEDGGEAARVARRLGERAAAAGSLATLADALLDAGDVLAGRFADVLRDALAAAPDASDPELADVAALLRDRDAAPVAILATVALGALASEIFSESRFGEIARLPGVAMRAAARIALAEASPWFPDRAGRDRAVVAAARRGAAALRAACGDDAARWSWSAIVDLHQRHPLFAHESLASAVAPPAEVAGSPFAVLQLALGGAGPTFDATLGPVARLAVDLATDELDVALAGGESGRAGSAHLLDLLNDFRGGRYRRLRLTADVKGDLSELVSG